MKTSLSNYFLLMTIFINSFDTLHAQVNEKYSKEIENKILQVEQNLASWVEIENAPKWNLQERMIFYKINGLSIAVIKNYKIAVL